MKYFSTARQSGSVTFREATLKGLAPDKGLYFPETIPSIGKEFLKNIEQFENAEIALEVIAPYTEGSIPKAVLEQIVSETVNFEMPLVRVNEQVDSLELFHGPTLAFKDVGARFMSRCLGYFAKERKDKVYVLVATSGDTGGAVANGFLGVEGVEVIILYPSGKVSSVQEKQLTTSGGNIHAIEVAGNFDDCQAMVKSIFSDVEINKKRFLTSANSINVARWLPQQFYYFFAWKQWKVKESPPVFSVPSGNFGNICAGLLARYSGLPAKHFIAACNANDSVFQYLHTGEFLPKKAVATISNAMDVGNPSNFIRILEMYGHSYPELLKMLSAYTIPDEQTKAVIREVYQSERYLLDPHGAVAWAALSNYFNETGDTSRGIILETAHPVKFYDVVEPVIQSAVPIPLAVEEQLKKEKQAVKMEADDQLLKEFLLLL